MVADDPYATETRNGLGEYLLAKNCSYDDFLDAYMATLGPSEKPELKRFDDAYMAIGGKKPQAATIWLKALS